MSESLRVLVVDDEPVVAEALALAVRSLGVPVEVVHDGVAALESARKDPPALVLLDVLLPKMDGLQVLRTLRAEHPGVPVVMLSGIYKKRQQVQEALQQGAREYLTKPLSTAQLWDLLERHLGRRAAELRLEALKGPQFVTRPLPQVVGELHRARETGLLLVRSVSGLAVLFLEDGRLVLARCSHPDARLDKALAAAAAPAAAVARATQLLDGGAGRAQTLETLGREHGMAEEALSAALAQQQRLHGTLPFTWPAAATSFVRSEMPRHEPFKVAFDLPALIAWGCRHLADDDALARWLPPGHARPRLGADPVQVAQVLGFSTSEAEFVALLDGTREVASLRAIGRLAQVDVNRVLAALTCLGLVAHEGAPEQPHRGATLPALPVSVLRHRPAARRLLEFHRSCGTGVVRFEGGEPGAESRVVYMERGRIAFASSTRPDDRLGAVLVAAGVITPEQLDGALETARQRPDLALGRILLDAKALSHDDLHAALVMQVRQVVCGLVAAGAGNLTCHEAPLQQRDVVPLALDTMAVVVDAVRALPPDPSRLPPPDEPLRISPAGRDLAAHLPLLPDELATLAAIAALPAPPGLLAQAREDSWPRALALLAELGLVEAASHEPVAAPDLVPEVTSTPLVEKPPLRMGEWDDSKLGHQPSLGDLPELDEPDFMPAFRREEPAATGFELLGSARPRSASAAAAVQAPPAATRPALAAEDLPALDAFVHALARHLARRSETLPKDVVDTLPARLRALFGNTRQAL